MKSQWSFMKFTEVIEVSWSHRIILKSVKSTEVFNKDSWSPWILQKSLKSPEVAEVSKIFLKSVNSPEVTEKNDSKVNEVF